MSRVTKVRLSQRRKGLEEPLYSSAQIYNPHSLKCGLIADLTIRLHSSGKLAGSPQLRTELKFTELALALEQSTLKLLRHNSDTERPSFLANKASVMLSCPSDKTPPAPSLCKAHFLSTF